MQYTSLNLSVQFMIKKPGRVGRARCFSIEPISDQAVGDLDETADVGAQDIVAGSTVLSGIS